MLRIQVHILDEKQNPPFDLEVPAEIPVLELDRLVSVALGWDVDASGQVQRHMMRSLTTSRVLHSWESLADAQVWDGTTLHFITILAAYVIMPSGKQIPLLQNSVLIGRSTDNAMTNPDEMLDLASEAEGNTVSRQHARLSYARGQWQLAHLSQTNQTRVNDQLIDSDVRMALRPGDRIEVGGVELQFHHGLPLDQAIQPVP